MRFKLSTGLLLVTVVALCCVIFTQRTQHAQQLSELCQKLENEKTQIANVGGMFGYSAAIVDCLSSNNFQLSVESKQYIESMAGAYIVDAWANKELIKGYSDDVVGGNFKYDDETFYEEIEQFVSLLTVDGKKETRKMLEKRWSHMNQTDASRLNEFKRFNNLLDISTATNPTNTGKIAR